MTIFAVDPNDKQPNPIPNSAGMTERNVVFDYLSTFVIVLVLYHHSVLAYTTFFQLNPDTPITFSPVIDSRRWGGFDLMVAFNDTFFMSLMFFISGLFIWRSLTRKGVRIFLRDRLIRLGLPIIIGVPILIPLAYYAGQLEISRVYGNSLSYFDFWMSLARVGFGTSGPLWFLWLLLAFACLVAVLYRVVPHLGDIIGQRASTVSQHPLAFFGVLLGISTAAYLPLLIAFGPQHWLNIGPFAFQASRLLLYLVYFLAGTAVGAYGLDNSLFQSDSSLARHWWGWLALGLMSFSASVIVAIFVAPSVIISGLFFTISCAAIVFGVIALFLRFAKRRVAVFVSLKENGYGMYIIHYIFVLWLQYWLLGTSLPAFLKGHIVFVATLLLSWGTIAVIRLLPMVKRVI